MPTRHRPRPVRRGVVLVAAALALIVVPAAAATPSTPALSSTSTVPHPAETLDADALEALIAEHARSGTIKGQLVVTEEFDDHADVCPTTPDGLPSTEEERRELIEEGRRLFHSTSALGQQASSGPTVMDEQLACVSCHSPPAFTDGRTHLVGPTEHRPLVPRHTPHLLRIGGTAPYSWDGRFACLQATIKNAITSPLEMNAAREPTQEQLDALALFVETLDVPDAEPGTDYDPELAAWGELLFAEYRGIDIDGDAPAFDGISCLHCHQGTLGTDLRFHPILLPGPWSPTALDPGHIDDDGRIRGFKTPVLRGVRLTAPYFHDGSMGEPTASRAPYVNDPPIGALLVMLEAYERRFMFTFTPQERMALVHYMLSL
jgi:cytochrome c peroxidase